MPHTIRALSFDADNCLFHRGYEPSWKEINGGDCQQVITKNLPLLDSLKAQNPNYKQTIVLIGSARQSVEYDRVNAKNNQTESIFDAIQKVATYLEVKLDKFLTSDIHNTIVPPGTSFDLATQSPTKPQPTCFLDDSKLSLLYAQTHKLATDYPNETILFEFYDDRGCESWDIKEDILEKLQAYFTQHPEALPSNVTLRLNHYEGEAVTPYPEIQGIGCIDTQYPKTAKQMVDLTCGGSGPLAGAAPSKLSYKEPAVLEKLPAQLPQVTEMIQVRVTEYLGSLFHFFGDSNQDEKEHGETHQQVPDSLS